MNKTASLNWFIIFPAIVMSLGWGLRGTIGGGQMGAMIPGAMVALSLAVLLKRNRTAAFLVLCGAAGIGMGGQMTYGLTLGYLRESETFWKGFAACFTKGAAWGISGSAVIGMALIREKLSRKTIILMMLAMVVGTVIGWRLINVTRYIDLSYAPDKEPRAEIWAGLLAGAASMLACYYYLTRDSFLIRFSLWGFLFGGIGFGVGSTFLALQNDRWHGILGIGWWKCMEFFFGLMYGAGLGIACYRNRGSLMTEEWSVRNIEKFHIGRVIKYCIAMALVFLLCYSNFHIPFLPIFSVLCAVMVLIGINSNYFSWQLGITLTCMAFIRDSWNYLYLNKGLFMKQFEGMGREKWELPEFQQYECWGWSIIVILTLLIGWQVARNYYSGFNPVVPNSILLIWTGVVFLIIKMFWHFPAFAGTIPLQILVILMGFACHYMTLRLYSEE